MFFWESSQMGFVEYPPGLTKLFSWGPFKNGLRLGISFLLLLVFVCAGTFFWKERKTVLKTENPSLFSFAEYPAACRRDALLRQGFGEVSSKLEERRRKGSAAWLRRNEAGYPAACRGENIGASFIYFCLLFIFAFVGCYSLLLIIPRYILPVAPLHLVIAAYVFQKILLNKKTVFEETSI
jgi:hypothetical protein